MCCCFNINDFEHLKVNNITHSAIKLQILQITLKITLNYTRLQITLHITLLVTLH